MYCVKLRDSGDSCCGTSDTGVSPVGWGQDECLRESRVGWNLRDLNSWREGKKA